MPSLKSLNLERGKKVRALSKFTTATALAVVAASSISVPAEARHHYRHYYHHVRSYRHYRYRASYRHYRHHYYGLTAYHYRYCRYSPGTTGLIGGGVGGALIGHGLIGHGLLGAAVGAVGGAVAGRAIDRSMTAPRRCYYR